jgi:hypothetical protein
VKNVRLKFEVIRYMQFVINISKIEGGFELGLELSRSSFKLIFYIN